MDSIPDFVSTQEFFWGVVVVGIFVNLASEVVRRLFSNGYLILNKKLKTRYERMNIQKTFEILHHAHSYDRLMMFKMETLQSQINAFVMLFISGLVYFLSFVVDIPSLKLFMMASSLITIVIGFSMFLMHIRQVDMCNQAEKILRDKEVSG